MSDQSRAKLLQAINRLQERNQDFVERKGITPYSQETDKIIETLVTAYNDILQSDQTISQFRDKCNRLTLICNIFQIPWEALAAYNTMELAYEMRFRYGSDFPRISRVFLDDVRINLSIRRSLVQGYQLTITQLDDLKKYQGPNAKPEILKMYQEYITELQSLNRELERYFEFAETNLKTSLEQLENDFYTGSFNPHANETAQQG